MALMRMTTSKLAESQVSEKKIFKLHSNKIAGKNQFYTNGRFLTEKKINQIVHNVLLHLATNRYE